MKLNWGAIIAGWLVSAIALFNVPLALGGMTTLLITILLKSKDE